MMKPFGERLVRPAEELDFQHRAGEGAEIAPAPRHPRAHRQAGAKGQNRQRRNRRPQFPAAREVKDFPRKKNSPGGEQRQFAGFRQKRRGRRQAKGGGEARRKLFRFPKFQQQEKYEAESERRKAVVVDRSEEHTS